MIRYGHEIDYLSFDRLRASAGECDLGGEQICLLCLFSIPSIRE
jgi:hypothetical protein